MNQLIRRLAALVLAFVLLLSMAACGEKDRPQKSSTEPAAGSTGEDSQQTGTETSPQNNSHTQAESAYNGLFDDTVVHTLDVSISEEDWADLLANPLEKTKYKTTVVIDGETLEQVSFATKGNTSLSSVASDPYSDRYSFKLNFCKYNKGQSYHGLDKLNLNNLYADATCLKDWLSYRIFRQAGVDAPLTSYVWLRVNGRDQGLYLAIEEIGESWLGRTQKGEGMLYKPETEEQNPPVAFPGKGEGQGGFPGNPPESFPGNPPESFPANGEGLGKKPGGMDFGDNAKGADLRYTDDNPDSYSDIFDNNETDMDEGAEERVIAALKVLSEGKADQALDTDEIIRYFAAHNFVLNYDSYIGTMLHNYYLYENDGKLSMLPWDYNLAFGGFDVGFGGIGEGMPSPGNLRNSDEMPNPGNHSSPGAMPSPGEMDEESPDFGEMGGNDATPLVNTGIDTPLSGATEDSRPIWAWIPADEAYLDRYHAVLDKLLSSYFENGSFEAELEQMIFLLRPYVEKDPTAFYSLEEFDNGVKTLRQFCLLRTESIRKQLEGDLSTRTKDQKQSDKVDASQVEIRSMGSMAGKRNTGRRQ